MSRQAGSAARERYRLVRTIASGGMAQVYEATMTGDAGFERRVAIKRILPELADSMSVRRMFLDEARVASRLSHANVVQVLDYGLLEDDEMIVFEHVDGIDAARAWRQRGEAGEPMPASVALHLVAEVAHALAHAHGLLDEAGAPSPVVHRDVSPQNVLLSWEGDVKLADFGIALAEAREEKTATGIVKGKLRYMPPEQAMGRRVGPPADVYALGATLEVLLPEPRDPEVDALIQRCCAERAEDRPTASRLAEDAERLARAGSTRSPRLLLREWLAPLRPERAKPRALDDVMGLCLVPVEGQAHQYTVSRRARALTGPTERTPSVPPPPEPTDAATGEVPHARRASPIVAVALLAAAAVGAGLLALARPWAHDAPLPPPLRSPATTADPGPAAPPLPPPAPPLGAPEPASDGSGFPAEPGEAAGTEPSGEAASRPRSRPPAASERPTQVRPAPPPRPIEARPSAPPRPVAETPAVGTGWLRVGGATLARGRVSIDGRNAGHAPVERELPVGAHHVVVRAADSEQVLAEQDVRIGDQHRRTTPARLIR